MFDRVFRRACSRVRCTRVSIEAHRERRSRSSSYERRCGGVACILERCDRRGCTSRSSSPLPSRSCRSSMKCARVADRNERRELRGLTAYKSSRSRTLRDGPSPRAFCHNAFVGVPVRWSGWSRCGAPASSSLRRGRADRIGLPRHGAGPRCGEACSRRGRARLCRARFGRKRRYGLSALLVAVGFCAG